MNTPRVHAANAVGNAGEGIFLAAGIIGLAAGFKKNQHIGEYWWRGIIGVVGLMVLASLAAHTRIAPIVKGIAWLTFIATCAYAYPSFKDAHQQHADHAAHVKATTYRGSAPQGSYNPGGSPTEGSNRH